MEGTFEIKMTSASRVVSVRFHKHIFQVVLVCVSMCVTLSALLPVSVSVNSGYATLVYMCAFERGGSEEKSQQLSGGRPKP